ncbi:dentin sialophosphoprotein-like isoform X2 [Lucilia cuprina]|uniref:dentin sialophosphoprotein-like isoform X2 n=1 Tax=Lucilia cuprina TaxID=7375 RepID=UPI001F05E10E|nr:dentin sialophosphoprotein-like isoform X2 [Lucilia cuprina]
MKLKFLIIFFMAVLALASASNDETTTVGTKDSDDKTETSTDSNTTEASKETTTKTPTDTDTTEASKDDDTTTKAPTHTDTTESSKDDETTTKAPTHTNTTESATDAPSATPAPPSFDDNVDTATDNLLGINCMIQAVYTIADNAPDFQYDISLCGSAIQTSAADVLNKVNELQTRASKAIQANNKTCKNANFNQNSDSSKTPSDKCVTKIKNTMEKLNDTVDKTLTNVNNLFNKTSNFCAKMALLRFRLTLNNFNAMIQECAKVAGA